MFDRDWFPVKTLKEIPQGLRKMRYWDRAATEKKEKAAAGKAHEPDFTAGALCAQHKGVLYIFDMQPFQANPLGNEERIHQTAEIDGKSVPIYLEQEPGSSGKDVVDHYQRVVLRGYIVVADRPTGDKRERAKPWCAMAQRGNVVLVQGPWVHNFLAEVEAYPHGKKDQVDAVSGAYKFLLGGKAGSIYDLVKE